MDGICPEVVELDRRHRFVLKWMEESNQLRFSYFDSRVERPPLYLTSEQVRSLALALLVWAASLNDFETAR